MTTEYIAVTDWTTISKGQKVQATRGGERVEFTVARKDTFGRVTYINNDMAGIQINSKDHPAWTIFAERPPVVLPTEPGFYMTAYEPPDVFQLVDTGAWFEGQDPITNAKVLHDGGETLTRLRPEAEVAAEVIAEVDDLIPGLFTPTELVEIAAKWAKK